MKHLTCLSILVLALFFAAGTDKAEAQSPRVGSVFMVDSIKYHVKSTIAVDAMQLLRRQIGPEFRIPDTVCDSLGNEFKVTAVGLPNVYFSWMQLSHTDVWLPEYCERVEDYALNCVGDIHFNSHLKYIETMAFEGSHFTELEFPEGLKSIGYQAFQNCRQLTQVKFPSTLKSIGGFAFYGCDKLNDIDLPDNLERIYSYAFSKARRVKLPANLKVLEDRSICMGTSVTDTMDVYSPIARPQLVTINGVAGRKPSFQAHQVNIHVPLNTLELYQAAPGWNEYNLIEDEEAGTFYWIDLHSRPADAGTMTLTGAFDVDGGRFLCHSDSTMRLHITPNNGNGIMCLIVGNKDVTAEVDNNGVYTFPPLQESMSVSVTFSTPDFSASSFTPLIIKQADGGEVEIKVYKNEPLKLNITPDEGWLIHSVTLNGKDITKKLDGYGDFTIKKVNGAIVVGSSVIDEVEDDNEQMRAFITYESDGSNNEGIEEVSHQEPSQGLRALACKGMVLLQHVQAGEVVDIYDVSGRHVRSIMGNGQEFTVDLGSGIYIIKSGGRIVKVIL